VANFSANAAQGAAFCLGRHPVPILLILTSTAQHSDRFGGGLDIETAPVVTLTGGSISGKRRASMAGYLGQCQSRFGREYAFDYGD